MPTDVPEVDPSKVMSTRSEIEKPAVPAAMGIGSVTNDQPSADDADDADDGIEEI